MRENGKIYARNLEITCYSFKSIELYGHMYHLKWYLYINLLHTIIFFSDTVIPLQITKRATLLRFTVIIIKSFSILRI